MVQSSLAALLLLAAPLCLRSAQRPEESWDSLRQLLPGESIEIVDLKMKSHIGAFAAYTQEEVSLRHDGRVTAVPRGEVASVKRRGESRRRRNVLLGLAAGAAAGLAVGVIRGKTYHEAGETPVFLAVWTPIGAGVGLIVGATLPARGSVTVYRAPGVRR